MDSYANIPSAPMKPSRDQNLRKIVYDTVTYGNIDCYCDEEAVIAELIADNNWRPTDSELEHLVNKYSLGKINTCIECCADLGRHNLTKLCRKTYCGNIV